MDWQDKVLRAARYNETRLGTILMAALGIEGYRGRAFARRASVTSDGMVMCSFTRVNGEHHMGAFVGALADILRNTAGIAAHCGLNASERDELYAAVVDWLGPDVYGVKRNYFKNRTT